MITLSDFNCSVEILILICNILHKIKNVVCTNTFHITINHLHRQQKYGFYYKINFLLNWPQTTTPQRPCQVKVDVMQRVLKWRRAKKLILNNKEWFDCEFESRYFIFLLFIATLRCSWVLYGFTINIKRELLSINRSTGGPRYPHYLRIRLLTFEALV